MNRRGNKTERRSPHRPVTVKLWKKYAERIDGVDLSGARTGDLLTVPSRDARLLIAEGWAALPAEERRSPSPERSMAADRPPRQGQR